jgi:hypothetical protein
MAMAEFDHIFMANLFVLLVVAGADACGLCGKGQSYGLKLNQFHFCSRSLWNPSLPTPTSLFH